MRRVVFAAIFAAVVLPAHLYAQDQVEPPPYVRIEGRCEGGEVYWDVCNMGGSMVKPAGWRICVDGKRIGSGLMLLDGRGELYAFFAVESNGVSAQLMVNAPGGTVPLASLLACPGGTVPPWTVWLAYIAGN